MLKKILLFLLGSFLLVSGIIAILKNWGEIVIVFKSLYGMALAVGGLIVLSLIAEKKD